VLDFLRSLTWSDPAEKDLAAENIIKVDASRLLAMNEGQRKILAFVQDFSVRHNTAPAIQSLRDFAKHDPELAQMVLNIEMANFYSGADFEDLFEREVNLQTALHIEHVTQIAVTMVTKGGKTPSEAVGHLFANVQVPPARGNGILLASIKASKQALVDEYERRAKAPQNSYGILSGYGIFDVSTYGVKPKQLYLHAGFPGHLKSTMIFNQMVNAAVDFGWNVMLFTTEMPATDVKLLLTAIHSAHKKFHGVHPPLSASRLLRGQLDARGEKFFKEVLNDLTTNPNHGSLRVVDSGEFSTLGSIIQRTTREHQLQEVDQVWIDYLTRLPVDHKYAKLFQTEARNETIIDAKRFAMSFDGGKGLAVCSAFQINREGFKKASDKKNATEKHGIKRNSYDLSNLAQYNAAEREADVITYSLVGDDERRTSQVKVGVLKSRWGEVPYGDANMFVDKDSRKIHDLTAGLPGVMPVPGIMPVDDVVI
jgi:replicative DNA helicase